MLAHRSAVALDARHRPAREAAAYFAIDSLRHYLVVHQDQPRVEHHWPTEGGPWQLEVVGPIDTIELTCPPVSIPLGELFEGLVA